jgi:hypothetical protein
VPPTRRRHHGGDMRWPRAASADRFGAVLPG